MTSTITRNETQKDGRDCLKAKAKTKTSGWGNFGFDKEIEVVPHSLKGDEDIADFFEVYAWSHCSQELTQTTTARSQYKESRRSSLIKRSDSEGHTQQVIDRLSKSSEDCLRSSLSRSPIRSSSNRSLSKSPIRSSTRSSDSKSPSRSSGSSRRRDYALSRVEKETEKRDHSHHHRRRHRRDGHSPRRRRHNKSHSPHRRSGSHSPTPRPSRSLRHLSSSSPSRSSCSDDEDDRRGDNLDHHHRRHHRRHPKPHRHGSSHHRQSSDRSSAHNHRSSRARHHRVSSMNLVKMDQQPMIIARRKSMPILMVGEDWHIEHSVRPNANRRGSM